MSSSAVLLDVDALHDALSTRDLTDPGQGPHAMQLLIDEITAALANTWPVRLVVHRDHPAVPIEDNYDRLGYPADAAARDARYTRYVSGRVVLRSQTSALIPPLLRSVAAGELGETEDVLLVCPGICYRRDTIDRLHTGAPHQLDLWRLRRGAELEEPDLIEMINTVAAAAVPEAPVTTIQAQHPYTVRGRQIDLVTADGSVEVGECGLAHPDVLANAELGADWSGLAMGLGLDRLLMLRKGVPDIRLLRSTDPRIAIQMIDLEPYRPVSPLPALTRDLSVVVDPEVDDEIIGDRVRSALGSEADLLESVEVLAWTHASDIPLRARERLGMRAHQRNALVRLVIRPLERTLTSEEGNALRDRIYAALHEGEAHQWAAGPPPQ